MNIEWLVKLLVKSSSVKNNSGKIKNYIKKLNIKKSSNLDNIDKKHITVCAVQEEIRILKNYKQYIDRMYEFIKKGVEQGAQLIAFPEENGTLVLGMLPFIEMILKKMNNQSSMDNSDINSKENNSSIDISGILSIFSPFMTDIFETTFEELSKAFGVYIMAGSIMLEDRGKVYNRAYLFGPDGNIVGVQDKAHLVLMEMNMGLRMGSSLDVFDTLLGKIAFPVCMDATYFETFKIVKNKGAQIVIIPIANMEEYNYYFALRGIWPRVQESGVYGIKSALVGDLYGLRFTGKAGVYAPIILTPNKDGVLKETVSYDTDEVVVYSIDIDLIDDYCDTYFSNENIEFFQKYYPSIYNDCQVDNLMS